MRKAGTRRKIFGWAGRKIGGRASTDYADFTDFQRVNEENRKAGTECFLTGKQRSADFSSRLPVFPVQ
jgi:hypothetical protein